MSDLLESGGLRQVDIEPAYRRVARMIEEQIVAGRLKTGQLLPTEGELAE
ncbi:GntR family transcriptional regulator [Rhizobium alvei]